MREHAGRRAGDHGTNGLSRMNDMTRIPFTTTRGGRRIARTVAVLVVAAAAAVAALASAAQASSRIKDIVAFEGVRDNLLVGYGLVVGLNKTGDTLKNGHFTKQSLLAMLDRLGVKPTEAGLDSKNVAAVMVTAVLPPFSRQGSRVDVTVSALGDSQSLLGGTLLVTPLLGADGEVYVVAQGQVAISGFAAGGAAQTVTKGVPTSGRIANGAIVEREVGFEMANLQQVKLSLRNPDFTTARRIAQAVNAFLGTDSARPSDPATVHVRVPTNYQNDVMGENVRVSTVAIAQGNLTIRITETAQVSQPGPFAQVGDTVTVPRTEIDVQQGEERRLTVLSEGVTLDQLVNGLNALGIGPRDLISILQTIKAAGALQARIEVM